jgi:uroporphyrinogen-III synthase
MKNNNLVAIFYSSRSAEIFAKLIKYHKLEKQLYLAKVFAFSENIAKNLVGLNLGKVFIPKEPNEEAMIAKFKEVMECNLIK